MTEVAKLIDDANPDTFPTARARAAERIGRLQADDEQFRNAKPDLSLQEAARRPGLRLPQILEMFVQGYADRPALGWRARSLVTDPATGRTAARLLPRFDTITYRDLWANVRAVAAAWAQDVADPLTPGDFVATVGFASPEYLTLDLACGYLGLVAVPLQQSAAASRLQPIIAEVEPRVIASGAGYLDLAVDAALGSSSLRRLVVFDYEPQVDEQRESLARARARLADAGMAVTIEIFDELVRRGRALPAQPMFTGDTDERLAMILYTSGSTGLPKGAMQTERMVAKWWTAELQPDFADIPVFNVNFMPLNHVGGRIPLATAFQSGGTSYFVPESDLSTLFEDWNLVRPTDLGMVPRVAEMLYQRYQSAVDRLVFEGADPAEADAEAKTELREHILGGRIVKSFSTTAPLAAEMKNFIEACLDVNVFDGYGLTELLMVARDGVMARPPVIDYKLVDVPELGYFLTDKPFPRGELLVKSETAFPGYFKRPDVTAAAFDDDGYYRTGDVMAELGPDHVKYVDRRNNVLKLAQGEFVAVARLEAVFSTAALVRQIFLYGNSERPYLLAVVVPTDEARNKFAGDALRAVLSESLRQTANQAELQSYEIPADFLVEDEPFSEENGLLSSVGKLLRPKLKEHYGEQLEARYAELSASRSADLRALRDGAADRPVIDTLTRAAQSLLGLPGGPPQPDAQFLELGGDSLSALTYSNLLYDLFDVEVPVGQIISPASSLRQIADYVEAERRSGSKRPTFATVHGRGATQVRAADLTLDKFIDAKTLAESPNLPRVTGTPHTVLLTGANGYLGRFLALEWLQRLAESGGKLVTIVRGADPDAAARRLEGVFDSGDPQLLEQFRDLAAAHLEIIVGDIGEPNLGLDQAVWDKLAQRVDLIVHPAALVNHVLPYDQLFGPNVVGTAELIRLAITTRIKPITYLSTVSVAMSVDPARFTEDGDIRAISPVRPIDDSYANGYGNSKWAGEVLLREANDLCGLPVAVFRSDLILAHSRYAGQLNVPDMFTRLIISLLATGIAPFSFYQTDAQGHRAIAHFDGLPAEFVAESVTTLGEQTATCVETTASYRSFDVMNPHDDGISLDVFVDWLIEAGHDIRRIDDHDEWLARFETALRALPEKQRQLSVLPLLNAYRRPERPLRGAPAPTDAFRAAVREAKIGADKDIPNLSAALIDKYVADLRLLGLI
ncbi:carboxylic acid reductase [Mycobacterium shigaense]|uniref:Carboxylic acid reductase n=1 Tax=Mycobacterium shigaense TaxID=722731 RepID=A0A1Z4EBS9_9MYCO|nr:carboxylic acid reductase [Mycobacterium shigaense]BAX90410.1 oxidoreductase [Mycobacterium shigaense]